MHFHIIGEVLIVLDFSKLYLIIDYVTETISKYNNEGFLPITTTSRILLH